MKKGFTLVEILVVIAIMLILLGIVLESITSAQAKTRDNKRISDIKSLQLALEQFFDANNQYPSSLDDTINGGLAPAYIPNIPTDPSTHSFYDYSKTGTGYSFCLGAQLEATATSTRSDNAGCLPDGVTPANPNDYYSLKNQ